jgi:D-threo-aldose 1-dehydrogenase
MTAQTRRSGRLPFASKIGLGTSGIGTMNQTVSEQQAEAILEAAYAAGIRNFDTAPFYGHGLSALRLGRFLRQRERSSFTVSTKVGRILVPPRGEPIDHGIWAAALELKPVFDYSYEGTLRALEQSANRLGFSDFDLVQTSCGRIFERLGLCVPTHPPDRRRGRFSLRTAKRRRGTQDHWPPCTRGGPSPRGAADD